MEENHLRNMITKHLQVKNYKKIEKAEKYIIAEGEIPICLIAHCDTVFLTPPKEFFFDQKKQVLWSPQGAGFDDRVGIAIILELLEKGYKPSIIITSGEEAGGLGAIELVKNHSFCPFSISPKFLIQLDRRGKEDCVFYDCNNKDFNKMIQGYGFKRADGTFSDISILGPVWGIAAVNLSVGYYSEHSIAERLFIKEAEATSNKVAKILTDYKKFPNYKYIKNKLSFFDFSLEKEDNKSDSFVFPDNECSWCGKKINRSNRHWIKDGDISMPLCDDCYAFCMF